MSERDPDSFETATVLEACPQCARPCPATYVQKCVDDQLRWSISVSCGRCGCAQEGDGGEADEAVRSVLIASNGEWEVGITALGADALGVMRILRSRYGVAPAELRGGGRPILRGAKTECHLVACLVESRGGTAYVTRTVR